MKRLQLMWCLLRDTITHPFVVSHYTWNGTGWLVQHGKLVYSTCEHLLKHYPDNPHLHEGFFPDERPAHPNDHLICDTCGTTLQLIWRVVAEPHIPVSNTKGKFNWDLPAKIEKWQKR